MDQYITKLNLGNIYIYYKNQLTDTFISIINSISCENLVLFNLKIKEYTILYKINLYSK